jgi:4a-hydroxytetrahydrobiopterin dehydratase
MDRLDDAARSRFLSDHPDWSIDGETLRRTFRFADFREAMGFVTTVALCAEVADHHPDIDIRWNKVTLALTTHEADALTDRDTDLAAEIDGRTDRKG